VSLQVVINKQQEMFHIGWKATIKYRYLDEGEIIEPTDFYFDGSAIHPPKCSGEPAPSPNFGSHRKYIRILRGDHE